MAAETKGLNEAASVSQTAGQDGENTAKGGGGPLSILFPPDPAVWTEARRLVSDKNLRVEALATCTSQDPVVVLDLLKISNAMFFSGGKSAISSTKTAIVRLGSDVVVDTLEKMRPRQQIEDPEISHWFEVHRSRCKRTAIVARILAEALARTLADDCQASGLFMFVGEMLAVAHFKENYVKLAKELSRSGVIYRLAQEHKFDIEKMGLSYLRRYGIPEAVVAAIDREARPRTPDRAIMKPLCASAAEMVDAFDSNRWEKIAPGKTLPPKSSLRMMQIPENQYLKIYERCSEYLFESRLLDEKKKQSPANPDLGYPPAESSDAVMVSPEQSELQDEIKNLLKGSPVVEEEPVAAREVQYGIEERDDEYEETDEFIEEDDFNLELARTQQKTQARVKESEYTPAPLANPPVTDRAKKIAADMQDMFSNAKNSEEIIANLLEKLVQNGPFQKSALIVVSKDRKRAIVVAARGPNIGNGQKLTIEDPLSPLAQCFSKIQSFGNRQSRNSPFGSKSYALAPLDADHDTPVALYADCGNDSAVPFEARRIFRTVVELINQKLPQVAGGIPIEV